MISTIELEQYIKKEIVEKIPEVDFSKINFCEGRDDSPEGTYVFTKDSNYHVLYTEKGKVRDDKKILDVEDVLWYVLDVFSFDMAMSYAMKNRVNGRDFRRALFKREIEIYALFGENFKKKKCEEIDEILKNNPYNDN